MQLIRGLGHLPRQWPGCVLTIGNFDGIHRGHQAVLKTLAEVAKLRQVPDLLMSFEPHPLEFFQPDQPPPRITALRDKIQALQGLDLQYALLLRFTRKLATLSAEDFIHDILVQQLRVRAMVVGDDFRFGAGRRGDFEMLRAAGKKMGFTVRATPSFKLGQRRVSSTAIRALLAEGDFKAAATCLGRPFSISGRVRHGDGRGRDLGFPTANVSLSRLPALQGVFVVRLKGLAEAQFDGVANLGTRPTMGGKRLSLEVNIFDFDRDIYGRHIEVEFRHKLRAEQRFNSLAELIKQISLDVTQARQFIAAQPG